MGRIGLLTHRYKSSRIIEEEEGEELVGVKIERDRKQDSSAVDPWAVARRSTAGCQESRTPENVLLP